MCISPKGLEYKSLFFSGFMFLFFLFLVFERLDVDLSDKNLLLDMEVKR